MIHLSVTVEGYTYEISLEKPTNGEQLTTVWIDGQATPIVAPDFLGPLSTMVWFIVNNRPYEVMIDPNLDWIRSSWGIHSLEIEDLETNLPRPSARDGRIKAPIPGLISQVMVSKGDEVELGQPLLVLEAMKMENEIRAPIAGRIIELKASAGQRVRLDEVLVEIE